jgi:hypothetical protein
MSTTTTADLDPPLVPDRYLSRIKALSPGIAAGVLWSLALKLSPNELHDEAADVIAAEIKQIAEDIEWLNEARAATAAIYA